MRRLDEPFFFASKEKKKLFFLPFQEFLEAQTCILWVCVCWRKGVSMQ